MVQLTTLALLTLVPASLAHFTLDYPPARGFDEDIEPNFCGGFPNPSAVRTAFPLGSAPISIDSHHANAQLAALISIKPNPTTFADFNSTSTNGGVVQFAIPFFSISDEGEKCFNVNIGALGIANVAAGTNATLQIAFNGGDGALYQCADITLSSTATVPSNFSCAAPVDTSAAAVAGGGAAATAASASVSASASMSTGSPAATTSPRSGAATIVVSGVLGGLAGLVALTLA